MKGPLERFQWEAFCQYYVSGKTKGNATASYRAAGYKGQGGSAHAAASRLLSRYQVRVRIKELTDASNRD